MAQKNLIKSPLNYTGGKYKLLKQIIPLLPKEINTFVDLFGGGFNVGINVKSDNTIYNDNCKQVEELLDYMYKNDTDKMLKDIYNYIELYNLTKENRNGFEQFREYYNEKNSSPIVFYCLLCYAFNYQIRFNKKGKYNMPFGKNRSSFNDSLKNKFIDFVNELHNKNIKFYNNDFREILEFIPENSFVYCDPPYYNAVASYNENNGWSEKDEIELLNKLDELNRKNIKFALSNNLKYDNKILSKWMDKYNVHYLNSDYSNCNYHKKDKTTDKEVLITNY